MDATICIASQRPDGLARLLASIGRLKRPSGMTLEVVIVHNAPEAAASDLTSDLEIPLRRFVEPRPNLSHARNRTVERASGRWLAFVDDDEVVDEDWLAAYWSVVETYDCDGFFGPVLPRLEPPASAWLDASFFARERFATGTPIAGQGARTGNAFVRRSLFDEFAFDPAFGLRGGEDWDLFRRMRARGRLFLWCDEARVDEFVPAERQRIGWLARRAFQSGLAYERAELCVTRPSHRARLRVVLGAAAACAGVPIAALAGRRRMARAWLKLCARIGRLRGHLCPPASRGAH